MASVRTLKKDIDLMMSLALNDCFYVATTNKKVDNEAVMAIASEIIDKHRELRVKVSHPDGKNNPKLVKQYYQSITKELSEVVDAALKKLSELNK